jgi:hypothetical protein
MKARQDEVNYLKRLVGERDASIIKLEKSAEDNHNLAVAETINRTTLQEVNARMLTQIEKLNADLRKAKESGGTTAVAGRGTKVNPPAEDVEGIVKATDPETGYLTLSIGSDAGLAKGNTLEVYRLKPDGKYLGTVEVLAVRHDQAVAKPMSRMLGAIEVGDRVASSVIGRK